MPEEINDYRRRLLGAAAITLAATELGIFGSPNAQAGEATSPGAIPAGVTAIPVKTAGAADDNSIRPFHISTPQADLVDLHRRIAATRWPDKETVADESQGVQFATMQKLAGYWGKDYDWRKAEAKLNALPQFVTTIDGLDIHFIHVRSKDTHALPVIITHGWPGSIIEQLKIIGPLTNPTAYGGKAEDAFDVVIPSLPGYEFSGKTTTAGWDPARIARGLIGIHTNMAATVPGDIDKAAFAGAPPPSNL
jgi:Epoxide hydrolase N terminus